MSRKIKIFRHDPAQGGEGYFEEFPLPEKAGLSVMDALDYIHLHLDPSLAYYSHSRCNHGICVRCSVKINGRNGLACETLLPVEGDIAIGPVNRDSVIKDLVCKKSEMSKVLGKAGENYS
ncbi:MAG: hypothetical protein GY866_24400 [Proteobacteria bacterium]|nr:hypothetical protein [Pseudomonadota bacterium]